MCGTDKTPWDGVACKGDTQPEHVCGQCAILYDTCYPDGAHVINGNEEIGEQESAEFE